MNHPVALSPEQSLHQTSEHHGHKFPYHTNAAKSRSPSPISHSATGQLLPSIPSESSPNLARHDSSAKSVPRRRRAQFLKSWWLEIGACCIFILALIAIVVTLRPHQNKPLPQWPYSISVNSLISIYAVILKATILLVTAESLGKYNDT